jgi:hypothetical protein
MNPNLPNLWLALRTMFTRMQKAVGPHLAYTFGFKLGVSHAYPDTS